MQTTHFLSNYDTLGAGCDGSINITDQKQEQTKVPHDEYNNEIRNISLTTPNVSQ